MTPRDPLADPLAELEDMIDSHDQAVVDVRFFEALRQFVTSSPASYRPTNDQLLAAGLSQREIDFLEFVDEVRTEIAADPGQYLTAVATLDVWLARMRGRWQIEDSEL